MTLPDVLLGTVLKAEYNLLLPFVLSRVAINQGLCRGWFTYADLCTLLDNSRFLQIMNTVRIDVLKVCNELAGCVLLLKSYEISGHWNARKTGFNSERLFVALKSLSLDVTPVKNASNNINHQVFMGPLHLTDLFK